jgi:hypothetical protein
MKKVYIRNEHIVMPLDSKIKDIDIDFRDGQGWRRFVIDKNISVIDIKINFVEDKPYRED